MIRTSEDERYIENKQGDEFDRLTQTATNTATSNFKTIAALGTIRKMIIKNYVGKDKVMNDLDMTLVESFF